ncbi:MAG TPA: hypothetical protein VKU89_09570 [Solirubrobacteraceae bacterium]|nr:hypothetical protein [Solirubrobacteraceae bacterium]
MASGQGEHRRSWPDGPRSAILLLAACAGAYLATRARAGSGDDRGDPTHKESDGHLGSASDGNDGYYDIRKGASGYVHILAGLGGVVVAGLVFVFTFSSQGGPGTTHPAELTFAAGLLALGFIGCTVGAFGFAALAGEQKLTPNLPAAGTLIGVGVIIGIASILGAFEILASVYLRPSRILFAWLVAGGGVAGSVYNAFTVVDEYEIRTGSSGLGPSVWLKTRSQAHSWAKILAVVGAVPVAAGIVGYQLGLGPAQSSTRASLFVAVGLAVTIAAVLIGAIRTAHSTKGEDSGIDRKTALAAQIVVGGYVCALLFFLPR